MWLIFAVKLSNKTLLLPKLLQITIHVFWLFKIMLMLVSYINNFLTDASADMTPSVSYE